MLSMATFRNALLTITTLMVVHLVFVVTGLYEVQKWIDVPMHFWGGVGIGLLALAIWDATIQKITFQKSLKPVWKMLVYFVGILGVVVLVGVFWEWYEFIFDTIMRMYGTGYAPAQMGIGDTMADLALDTLGGLLAFTLFRNRTQP